MDEYDLRRLPEFKSGQIKLSAEDIKCLMALDPRIADDELRRVASCRADVEKITAKVAGASRIKAAMWIRRVATHLR